MYYPGLGKDSDGDLLLVVSGSVDYAHFLSGWQEFKDHLRTVIQEQPGWTDVLPSRNQRRGDMQAWARLRDVDDADAAYSNYTSKPTTTNQTDLPSAEIYHRYKGMLVHVWETCRNSEGFRLRRCNCAVHFPEVPHDGHSPGRCGIDIARVRGLNSRTTPKLSPHSMPSPPRYPYSPCLRPRMYTETPAYLVQVPQPTVYPTSFSGFSVRVDDRIVLPETRDIVIRNLNHTVHPEELIRLVSTVGRPSRCGLHRDSKTGAFKGVATAEFSTRSEARDAVIYLNGTEHMGMKLDVRLNTVRTAIGGTEPMIVNGSFTSGENRP